MQEVKIALFQHPSPKIGQVLYQSNQRDAFIIGSRKLLAKNYSPYQSEELLNLFEPIWAISSPVKHLEVTFDTAELDWQAVLQKMKQQYEQLIWLQIQVKKIEPNKTIYFFDFIPLARKCEGFPIEVNLTTSLTQELGKTEHPLKHFVLQLEQSFLPYLSLAQKPAFANDLGSAHFQGNHKIQQLSSSNYQVSNQIVEGRRQLKLSTTRTKKTNRGLIAAA
ncbi:hypothetical protein [Isobaculum melis]|uniref:Uncharacterized protein n=1 Tax=Isobaculum melis TaxID=142588 RepID=A0A1H9S2V8_9LACT|nr:hypothetical protein [Isobaculum melis]SER79274.1 hypothetical protein SAMN04488559_10667 [Isobaculum melis]